MMDIVKRLQLAADDPMWANHSEVSKSTLCSAADIIDQLRAERDQLKAENARLAIDNELANSMLEKLRDTNETRGKALAAQCTETKKLKARVGELEAALEVADDGMGYAHRLLTEQSQRVLELEAQLKGREGWIPSVLFDGYAVLQGLSDAAKSRTSAENVSDVLDSAVKLIRAAAPKGE